MSKKSSDRNSASAAEPADQAGQKIPLRSPTTEALFRSIVEAANEGIWIVDLKGITIFANDRMAALLGTTADQLDGRAPFEFLFEEDLERARTLMEHNFKGEPVEFELRFRRVDGGEIPVLGGSSPLRGPDGQIIGSVATFSDLTERKATERALIKSEREATETAALLNRLLEAATDAIWMRSVDGRFLVANRAAASVMGQDPAHVVGADIYEIWPAPAAKMLEKQTNEILKSGVPLSVEEEMFDAAKGTQRIFLSDKVPLYAVDGSPVGVLGISRDITDRKLMENELRESETRLGQQVAELNALYASTPIGLAFFDRDYRFLRVNRELAHFNRLPAEDHIGHPIRDISPAIGSMVEPVIDRVFATGEGSPGIEIDGNAVGWPEQHWLAGFYPVMSDSGEVDTVGVWVVEVTESKAAEQRELLLAREVDHRAKNLLAVIQSIVQLSPAEEGAAALKTSIVGRIQALAHAHSLLSESRWEGVDFGELVEEELAPFITGGAHISYEGPRLKLRSAAAQSLALVLHELATNAAKYGALSSDHGELRVEWHRDQDEHGVCLIIRWNETGGPEVTPPTVFSFGSSIIRASVERQLRGKVIQEWRPEGLLCTLRIPASEVVPGPEF